MYDDILRIIKFLEDKANKLENMVAENNRGGWSINNNAEMTNMANDFRRTADELRQLL